MAAAVSNEERLFSLVLALLATETGLTKADILSSVQGYRQRYRANGGNASLERQFERDKEDIRDLGVPLESIELPADQGAVQYTRYRIPKGEYDLPADVTFTPQEIALLDLAALAWREGSLSGESRRALLKLRSLGIESEEPLIGFAPRLRARDAAFDPLQQAIERRRVVAFGYLKPGEDRVRRRRVAPLALVQFGGRWHVHGTDLGARDRRTFLLSRITGPVEETAETFEAPPGEPAEEARAGLRAVFAANRALLELTPDTDAAARLGSRGEPAGEGVVAVHFTDLALLADEVAAFGPEVLVREPPELVDAVRARLAAAAAAHGGGTGG
ncbi:helix-turn-helix transcriptional regulator [Amnibacterium setariae]|uniref:WYL domain-containing protein n=1 Tax=Amnibacterium setariae TaxID=2306585 RepID=A0A3A1U3Y1_9MICO|nr:WYL domain-containing protein [Amnibacterium setariae]RIX27704.1 WYL domain-containing protein [Amnibacterium setariae]